MQLGRAVMMAGAVIFAVGLLLYLSPRLPFKPGRLPGDIVIRGKNTTFYFPIVTCLLLSVLFTLVTWLMRKR